MIIIVLVLYPLLKKMLKIQIDSIRELKDHEFMIRWCIERSWPKNVEVYIKWEAKRFLDEMIRTHDSDDEWKNISYFNVFQEIQKYYPQEIEEHIGWWQIA